MKSRLMISFDDGFLRALDDYRASKRPVLPRTEAIRILASDGLLAWLNEQPDHEAIASEVSDG